MEEIKYLTRQECIEKLVNECKFYQVEDVWHITSSTIGLYKNRKRFLLRDSIIYYTSFLPSDTSNIIRLYYFINNIKIILNNCCKLCGTHVKFKDFYTGYRTYCSVKCLSNDPELKETRKLTCLHKYGVEYTLQSKQVRDASAITIKEKYGVDYISQSSEIKDKKKQTTLNKYGYEHSLQVPSIREDIKNTCNQIYGGNAPTCSQDVVNLREKNYLEKTGYSNPAYNPKVTQVRQENCLVKYGVDHYSKTDMFSNSISEAWKNFSDEKLLSISQKHSDFQQNRSQESISTMVEKCKNTYFSRTGYYYNVHNPNSSIYINKPASKKHKDFDNIYYDSNDELYFLDIINDLNLNRYIKRGPHLKYKNIKERRYIVDFILEFPTDKYLIEIKATHQYFHKDLWDGTLFAKWKVAEKYCMDFNFKEYIFILNKKITTKQEIINDIMIPYFLKNYPFL